jgi:hypothetical protein
LIDGAGFTYTVTVNALPELLTPEQVPNDGVTRYTAVCVELVRFVNVPVIFPVPLPATPPVNEAVEVDKLGIPHVKNVFTGTVPFTPFVPGVGVTVNTPLHIVVLIGVTDGLGSI